MPPRREQDSAIKLIRQTAVSTTDPDRNNNQLGKRAQLRAERGLGAGVPQGKADRAVGGDDLEQHRKQVEGGFFFSMSQPGALVESDGEQTQGDVAEVEDELVLMHVGCSCYAPLSAFHSAAMIIIVATEVFFFFVVVVVDIDPRAYFFIYICLPHGDGGRENRDIHHRQKGDLHRRMESRKGQDRESCCPSSGDLE